MRRSLSPMSLDRCLGLGLVAIVIGGTASAQSTPHRTPRSGREVVVASHVVSDTVISSSDGSHTFNGSHGPTEGCSSGSCEGECSNGRCFNGSCSCKDKLNQICTSAKSGQCNKDLGPQDVDPTTVGGAAGAYGTSAGMVGRRHNPPDLFANYYTQGQANQINAQMYIAPVPVPPWVGHTWNTYQPFAPHQFMYTHSHRYHHYYDQGRGLNRTHVSYRPAAHQVVRDIYMNFRIPR
jgi:hypothetical protein